MKEFSPKSDGYILNLSRKEFEIIFEDTLDIEVFEEFVGPSVGKTLNSFLRQADDTDIQLILDELRKLKG
jgi:hypothetical protein